MASKFKKTKRAPKFAKIHRLAHEYKIMSVTGLAFFVLTFGFSMAKMASNSVTLSFDQEIQREQLPALIRDMQFEDTQVKRDITRLMSDISSTEKNLKNTAFKCESLTQSHEYLDILSDFDAYVNNISVSSPTANIAATYQLFGMIRGSKTETSLRTALYGGTDAATSKKIVGNINQLATCRTIAQVVKKNCNTYGSLKTDQPGGNKEYRTLIESVKKEIKLRCEAPNTVMLNSRITVADLTPADPINKSCVDVGNFQARELLDPTISGSPARTTSCTGLIEKYLGTEKLIQRLRK